jgi:hypothetical protein
MARPQLRRGRTGGGADCPAGTADTACRKASQWEPEPAHLPGEKRSELRRRHAEGQERFNGTVAQELIDRTFVPVDLVQGELEGSVQKDVHRLGAKEHHLFALAFDRAA